MRLPNSQELEDFEHVYCCIDDTDDILSTISTGFIAEQIAASVSSERPTVALGITRHQLLLSDEIAYTSHNSSMCFSARMDTYSARQLMDTALTIIDQYKAPDSDPGLCVARIAKDECKKDVSEQISRLIAFGQRAKHEVCTKEEAFALADSIDWVTLVERGGTGEGVIGALAGVGLRMGGNDGRFRGKWNLEMLMAGSHTEAFVTNQKRAREQSLSGKLEKNTATHGGVRCEASAESICRVLGMRCEGTVRIVDVAGDEVDPETRVELCHEAKPILQKGCLTLVVEVSGNRAVPCMKVDLGSIGISDTWNQVCDHFVFDPDREERAQDSKESCRNCQFRKWTVRGFECVATPYHERLPHPLA